MSIRRRVALTIVFLSIAAGPAAAQVPPSEIVAALIATLKDADSDVRIHAAAALAEIGPEAVNALIETVNAPGILPEIAGARASAAYALGLMGAPATPAMAALVKALKDDVTDVRRQSAQAIARILSDQKSSRGAAYRTLPKGNAPDVPPPEFPPLRKKPS